VLAAKTALVFAARSVLVSALALVPVSAQQLVLGLWSALLSAWLSH
jgi:hypothetical protein